MEVTLHDFWSEVLSHELPCGLLECPLLERSFSEPSACPEKPKPWGEAMCGHSAQPPRQSPAFWPPTLCARGLSEGVSSLWPQIIPASWVFPRKTSDRPLEPHTISWPMGFGSTIKWLLVRMTRWSVVQHSITEHPCDWRPHHSSFRGSWLRSNYFCPDGTFSGSP